MAIGTMAFHVPEVQAACIGGDSVCTTFDPSSASNPTNIGGFDGGLVLPTGGQLNRFRVNFTIAGYTGPSFNLTNILVQGDGITGSLAVPNVTASGNGTFVSSYVSLTTALTQTQQLNYLNSRISFTIPAGISLGTAITAELFYASTAETGGIPANSITSGNDFVTTATMSSVPAPLPLLGAGAAFGFSRTLRKRIKAADQA